MSARNTLENKRLRRIERRNRKEKSRKLIHQDGVHVKKNDVMRHAYAEKRGLKHSALMVAVFGMLGMSSLPGRLR